MIALVLGFRTNADSLTIEHISDVSPHVCNIYIYIYSYIYNDIYVDNYIYIHTEYNHRIIYIYINVYI